MSYVRYFVRNLDKIYAYPQTTPKGQAGFNAASFAGGIVDTIVDNITGNDFLGDVAGAATALGIAVMSGPDGVTRNAATGEPI